MIWCGLVWPGVVWCTTTRLVPLQAGSPFATAVLGGLLADSSIVHFLDLALSVGEAGSRGEGGGEGGLVSGGGGVIPGLLGLHLLLPPRPPALACPVLFRQLVGGLAAEPHDHTPQAAVLLEVLLTSRWLPLPMVLGLTVVLDVLLWVRSLEVRGWWRCIVAYRPYPTPSFSRLLLCMPPQLF